MALAFPKRDTEKADDDDDDEEEDDEEGDLCYTAEEAIWVPILTLQKNRAKGNSHLPLEADAVPAFLNKTNMRAWRVLRASG